MIGMQLPSPPTATAAANIRQGCLSVRRLWRSFRFTETSEALLLKFLLLEG
jgi:hypothetical protein